MNSQDGKKQKMLTQYQFKQYLYNTYTLPPQRLPHLSPVCLVYLQKNLEYHFCAQIRGMLNEVRFCKRKDNQDKVAWRMSRRWYKRESKYYQKIQQKQETIDYYSDVFQLCPTLIDRGCITKEIDNQTYVRPYSFMESFPIDLFSIVRINPAFFSSQDGKIVEQEICRLLAEGSKHLQLLDIKPSNIVCNLSLGRVRLIDLDDSHIVQNPESNYLVASFMLVNHFIFHNFEMTPCMIIVNSIKDFKRVREYIVQDVYWKKYFLHYFERFYSNGMSTEEMCYQSIEKIKKWSRPD